ncbi:MAG: YwaF family protein [Bacilli bacterium]|nr:YwaF family protein [Bacilli bacterium]
MTLTAGFIALGITIFVIAIIIGLLFRLRNRPQLQWLRHTLAWILVLIPAFFLLIIKDWQWAAHIDPVSLAFNWFHYLWIALLVLTSGSFIMLARSERFHQERFGYMSRLDLFTLRFGVLLLSIEIVKQIYFANLFIGQYQFYLLPFQFCSVPMFVCLIAPLLKPGYFKKMLYDFLSLFMFIAGFAVMVFPTTVYTQAVYICFHTMIWHGGMAAVGIYIMTARRVGTSFKQWLRGGLLLSGFVLVATLTNILIHYFGRPEMQGFKAFFLDPWAPDGYSAIFVISSFYSTFIYQWGLPIIVGFPLYLIVYLTAFGLGSMIVFLLARLCIWLMHKKEDVRKFDLTEEAISVFQ